MIKDLSKLMKTARWKFELTINELKEKFFNSDSESLSDSDYDSSELDDWDEEYKSVFTWVSCQDDACQGKAGIRCKNLHSICVDCMPFYVNDLMSDPKTKFPLKCLDCRVDMKVNKIYPYLTETQKTALNSQFIEMKPRSNEVLMNCPFCTYYELWDKSLDWGVFSCKNIEWSKVSCVHCSKELKMKKSKQNPEFSVLETHPNWSSHKALLEEWEKVISIGSKRSWPNCETDFMLKDNGCTHITCPNWRKRWWYVCSKPESKWQKEGTGHVHNTNWQTDKKRCPLFLHDIHTVDKSWPREEKKCEEMLLKLLTFKRIKKFIKKHTKARFYELAKAYPSVLQHGYDVKEALGSDSTIICRSKLNLF